MSWAEAGLGSWRRAPYRLPHDVHTDHGGSRPHGRRPDDPWSAYPGRDRRVHGRRRDDRRGDLCDLPDLTPEDVAEALRYAAEPVRERQLPLRPSA